MSVGLNLAVQEAVAAATLAEPLRRGRVTPANLAGVRARRLLPTIVVQILQRLMHAAWSYRFSTDSGWVRPKSVLALLQCVPQVSLLPAYLVGVGPRPEHAPAGPARRARVYQCGECDQRCLGEQWRHDCNRPMAMAACARAALSPSAPRLTRIPAPTSDIRHHRR